MKENIDLSDNLLFGKRTIYSRRASLEFPLKNPYKYTISAYSLLEYLQGMIISLFYKSIQRINSYKASYNYELQLRIKVWPSSFENKNKRYFNYSFL